ncbi:MAG: ankyrin repeat domain-containing protein [Pyrinomonadaceae bacterium]
MSAAVTRTNRVEHDTDESTPRAETSVPVKLEARPVVDDYGMTPLMRAASDGSAGTVQALLDRGVEVNAKRTDGFNALALAAFFGHAQVVWVLVENGADLSATGRSETLPEMWADIRGFMEIGDTIREARAAKQVEAPNTRATVIAEPARFSRPAETERFEPGAVAGSGVEVPVITESQDPEATVVRPRAPVDEESQSSVIDAASENRPTVMPEPLVEEIQPVVIDAASDPEATLVRPRAPVEEANEASVIDAASEITLAVMPEPVVEEIQPVVIDAASDPEATLVRPLAPVDEANEASAIDSVADSDLTLVSTDAPFSQHSTARRVEPLEDIFPPVNHEHAQHQPIIRPPVRVLQTLPEIEDPPPLLVPEFHPASAFVARITSSRKNLVALILAGWLGFTAVGAFLFPQILKAFTDGRTETVNKTTSLTTESSNPVVASENSVPASVETPSAAITEPLNAPASNATEENTTDKATDITANTGNIESASRVEPVTVTEGSDVNDVARGSESRAHSVSSTSDANSVPEVRSNRRALTEATSMSRPAPARKQRAVSRASKFQQQTADEEQPKPAPLSVEVSRSSSVLATPARSASEVPGSQPPPLSIISGKPKSKVIQWP